MKEKKENEQVDGAVQAKIVDEYVNRLLEDAPEITKVNPLSLAPLTEGAVKYPAPRAFYVPGDRLIGIELFMMKDAKLYRSGIFTCHVPVYCFKLPGRQLRYFITAGKLKQLLFYHKCRRIIRGNIIYSLVGEQLLLDYAERPVR